jgi:hypothetical protein
MRARTATVAGTSHLAGAAADARRAQLIRCHYDAHGRRTRIRYGADAARWSS